MPTIPTQLKMWQELRDALNKTGRPIYTEFCPRSYGGTLVPPNKTTQDCNPGERCINDGPPHEWDGPTRANLANAILTEFGNSHDNWGSAMSNLDALLTLRPQPDVDGPGFFSDGDMLQTCNFGFGGTNCNAARGQCPSKGHMTQDEYTAQFATWSVLASQMIISADLRNLQSAQPECFKLLKNADILAVSKVTRDPSPNHASKNCQLTCTVWEQDAAAHAPTVLFTNSVNSTETRDGHNVTKTTVTAHGFSRKMADGSVALLFLNRQDRGSLTLTATWSELGLPSSASCKVRDLIAQQDLPSAAGNFSASVGSHRAQFVRISCGSSRES